MYDKCKKVQDEVLCSCNENQICDMSLLNDGTVSILPFEVILVDISPEMFCCTSWHKFQNAGSQIKCLEFKFRVINVVAAVLRSLRAETITRETNANCCFFFQLYYSE